MWRRFIISLLKITLFLWDLILQVLQPEHRLCRFHLSVSWHNSDCVAVTGVEKLILFPVYITIILFCRDHCSADSEDYYAADRFKVIKVHRCARICQVIRSCCWPSLLCQQRTGTGSGPADTSCWETQLLMAQSGHINRPERKCMTLQRYPENPQQWYDEI